MCIETSLTRNTWGHVALFLEQVHPFAQASRACKKIASQSLYPAFWNEYLKLPRVRPYAEKLEALPESAAKVRALFERLVNEIRAIGEGVKYLEALPKPTCSLQPARLAELARSIAREKDDSLVWLFKGDCQETIIPFLDGLESKWDEENEEWAEKAKEVRNWISVNTAKLSKMTKLDVRIVNLTLVPEEITLFESLTELYLSDNKLVTIPESFTRLRSLERLCLRINSLSALPADMCKLTKLEYLSLSGNAFVVVPDLVYTLSNLTELYLDNNELQLVSLLQLDL